MKAYIKEIENVGRCGRQNMLRPYLKMWEWEWIFGRAVKAISSQVVRSPCCYEFKKELDPIVQWLMVADCAMAESLARICIICLAIILELSPQDIVLHINVKSEIIPLVVVACGIWWKNEIGRKLLVYCHCNCSMRNNAMAWSYVLRFRCNRILSYLSHSCRSIYYVHTFFYRVDRNWNTPQSYNMIQLL